MNCERGEFCAFYHDLKEQEEAGKQIVIFYEKFNSSSNQKQESVNEEELKNEIASNLSSNEDNNEI